MHTKTWHVDLNVFEDGPRTRVEAVLRTESGLELRQQGLARRNPVDRYVPEIGDELAASRALAGLAHDLLEAAVEDVDANVHAR